MQYKEPACLWNAADKQANSFDVYMFFVMDSDLVKFNLQEIRKFPGNEICADCGKKGRTGKFLNLVIKI